MRYHPDVTLEEVMALSAWMTVKNAAVNLPLRRRQGRHPHRGKNFSNKELEKVTRRYTSEIGLIIGPNQDIPAPDVNTNGKIMAWMMDTYSMNVGATATGVVTGKPIQLGGSLGRVNATGRGVFVVGREAMKNLGMRLEAARVAVQGFGNVGSVAAKMFAARRQRCWLCKTTAARFTTPTAWTWWPYDYSEKNRGIAGFAGGDRIENENSWDVETDVLIQPPWKASCTGGRAERVKTKLVLEGANGPDLLRPT